jgi:hypothetical protein
LLWHHGIPGLLLLHQVVLALYAVACRLPHIPHQLLSGCFSLLTTSFTISSACFSATLLFPLTNLVPSLAPLSHVRCSTGST